MSFQILSDTQHHCLQNADWLLECLTVAQFVFARIFSFHIAVNNFNVCHFFAAFEQRIAGGNVIHEIFFLLNGEAPKHCSS